MHFSIFLLLYQLYLKFQCFSKNCSLFLLCSTSLLYEISPFSFLFLHNLHHLLLVLLLHLLLLPHLFLLTHLHIFFILLMCILFITFLSSEPCLITTVLPSIPITFPGPLH